MGGCTEKPVSYASSVTHLPINSPSLSASFSLHSALSLSQMLQLLPAPPVLLAHRSRYSQGGLRSASVTFRNVNSRGTACMHARALWIRRANTRLSSRRTRGNISAQEKHGVVAVHSRWRFCGFPRVCLLLSRSDVANRESVIMTDRLKATKQKECRRNLDGETLRPSVNSVKTEIARPTKVARKFRVFASVRRR